MFILAETDWISAGIAVVGLVISTAISAIALWQSHKASKESESALRIAHAIEKHVALQEEAKKLSLDISSSILTDAQGDKWLVVQIENNSQVVAQIESVALVWKGGSKFFHGVCEGQLKNERTGKELFAYPSLPGYLEPGTNFSFRFTAVTNKTLDGKQYPIDYGKEPGVSVEGVEVRANNKSFPLVDTGLLPMLRQFWQQRTSSEI